MGGSQKVASRVYGVATSIEDGLRGAAVPRAGATKDAFIVTHALIVGTERCAWAVVPRATRSLTALNRLGRERERS